MVAASGTTKLDASGAFSLLVDRTYEKAHSARAWTRLGRSLFIERAIKIAATIGFYILVANYLDFLPITLVPDLHPANTDVNQTAAMAVVVFVLLHWYNIRLRGFKGYLLYYTRPHELPVWARAIFTPLNVIEEIVKPVTLALRLFGNLLAGLLMLYVIGLLLPPVLATPVVAIWKLFDVLFIGLIQAFIFMLLTLVYFGLAREGLEQEHSH